MTEIGPNNFLPRPEVPKAHPHETHEGFNFNSPLQDLALAKIRQSNPTAHESFSFPMLGDVIAAEKLDLRYQRRQNHWTKAGDFFNKHKGAKQYLIEPDGDGPPQVITRGEFEAQSHLADPFEQAMNKLTKLESIIANLTTDSSNTNKAQINDVLEYVRHHQVRWKRKMMDPNSDLDAQSLASANYEIFNKFYNMLTNQLSLKDIENYIQNVEKSKSDATNTEVNHPFFPLSPTHNEGYKKRNEILDNLIEKYSHDRDLRFVDLINLWTAEKDDNLTRFKQLRDETKLANEYFTDNPGASEITIYALSDGSFTTNPINNTDISIEDSRAFRKRRMEDLAQRISFYETEGADLKLDRYINLVQQMSNNKTVADLDKHDLSTFLTLQSERSTGKAREVFELLIAQVELYNYAV